FAAKRRVAGPGSDLAVLGQLRVKMCAFPNGPGRLALVLSVIAVQSSIENVAERLPVDPLVSRRAIENQVLRRSEQAFTVPPFQSCRGSRGDHSNTRLPVFRRANGAILFDCPLDYQPAIR